MKRELQIIARWFLPVAVAAVFLNALIGCSAQMLEEGDVLATSAPVDEAIAALGGPLVLNGVVLREAKPEVWIRDGFAFYPDRAICIFTPEGECVDGYQFGKTIVITKRDKWSDSALCHEVLHFLGWKHDGGDFTGEGLKRVEHCRTVLMGLRDDWSMSRPQ